MSNNNTPTGFYDRYDRANKGWKKVLWRPGYPLQAAELNEMQSILTSESQQIGLALFREGGVLSGCDIVVNGDKTNVTIARGQIYALGYTHDTEEVPTLAITGVGEENIGVVITQVVADEATDPDLLDPAVGAEGYGYTGAHRLTYSYEFVVNNDNSIRIASLLDGRLDQTYNQLRPTLDSTMKLLAQRTFDESGHYTVKNYVVTARDLDVDHPDYNAKMAILAKDGVAYVKGWKVENESDVLLIDRAVETAERLDEPSLYDVAVSIYGVDNEPIREFIGLTATVESPAISIVRDSVTDTLDELPAQYQPTVAIVAVSSGALPGQPGAINYSEGPDYLLSGNYIDWSPGGQEPTTGTTYYVVVNYIKQMVPGERRLVPVVEDVTKTAASGGLDQFANADLRVLSSITYGETTYIENTHYTLNIAGGSITWLGGDQPGQNAVYQATYEYWEHDTEGDFLTRSSFVDDTGNVLHDFTPTKTLFGDSIDYRTQLSFDTNAGDVPVDSTLFYKSYNYALARRDVLVVDYRGYLRVERGVPARQPGLPSSDPNVLKICKILVPAEGRADDATFQMYDMQRMTMEDLRTFLREFKDVQYNQAVNELAAEASSRNLPTEKRGIFVDNFATFGKGDFGSADMACTIDVLTQSCGLPQVAQRFPLESRATPSAEDIFMLPYSDKAFIVQPYATDTIQVNPYTFVSMNAELDLDPQHDEWTETTHTTVRGPDSVVTLPPEVIRNRVFLAVHGPRNSDLPIGAEFSQAGGTTRIVPRNEWSELMQRNIRQTGGTRAAWSIGFRQIQESAVVSETTSTISSVQQITESVSIEELPFARQIPITIAGSLFLPDEDDIQCWFDGRVIPMQAVAPTVHASNEANAVRADSDGNLTATISVPEDTSSGSHLIELAGVSTGSGAGSRAAETFFSQGYNRRITQTISFVNTRQETRVIEDRSAVDPVAQTFGVSAATFISKVGVFFKQRPVEDNVPIDVLIVPTDNGIPTQTVVGRAMLQSQDCTATDDASEETIFTFRKPVFVRADVEYAFIVRTNNEQFVLHMSRVGQRDPVNGWVNTNPNTGVLLTSANMSTWSAEQNADLKFTMYRCSFSPTERIVTFDKFEFDPQISRFELKVVFAEPDSSTLVRWQYSIDNDQWFDFVPPVEVDIGVGTSELWVRALMTGTERASPVVVLSGVMHGYYFLTEGSYLGRQFALHEEDCRYVNIWTEVNLPAGCAVDFQVNFDDGDGWHDMSHVGAEDRQVTPRWLEQRHTYDTGSNSTLKQDVQVRANFSSGSPYATPRISRFRAVCSTI